MNAENVLFALGLSRNEARIVLRAYRRELRDGQRLAKLYGQLDRAKERANVSAREFANARERIVFASYRPVAVD